MQRCRAGFTLLELLVVLCIAGVVLAIAVPRAQSAVHRASVQAAAGDVHASLNFARTIALVGGTSVTVSTDSGTVRVIRRGDTVLTRRVAGVHGVRMTASRDSMVYGPYGLGHGIANLSIALRRGNAADTVFISRMGRVR